MIGMQRPKVHRTPRKALSPLQAETLRAELPTLRDRCLWGLMYAAGLRPEEALALRWSDVLELELTGGTLSIERVYSAGEIRETTKTGKFRDVPIVPTLAADLIALHELAPLDPDALVIATGTGTPVNPNNWRNRVFNVAKARAGVAWAIPYTGRATYISLQIHAGLSPVTVAALAGNSAAIVFKHYAREFDRSRGKPSEPLADVLAAARAEISGPLFGGGDATVLQREGGEPITHPSTDAEKPHQ
jgi:integrase